MPRPTRKTRDQSSRAGEVPWPRRREESGAGGAGKKKFITTEAGICMKTNKTTTICPAKKRHFCITERHFMQRHTSFAEIGGFLVTFRALKNEFLTSKSANSRHGRGAMFDTPDARHLWQKTGGGGIITPHHLLGSC